MRKSGVFAKVTKSKGFTLAELLIVIAIIGILAGVSALGASAMMRNQRQKASNDAAENIALAFQNRLEEIYAFEYERREILVKGSRQIGNNYYIGWVGSDVCVGTVEGDESSRNEARRAAYNLLTDNGNLLAEEFMNNGIILKYDPIDCRVYSVLYSSDNSKLTVSNLRDMDNEQILDLFAENVTSSYVAEATVGTYTIDTNTLDLAKGHTRENINVRIGHYVNGERRLLNYDKLIANIEVKFPIGSDVYETRIEGKQIRMEVKIKGEESNNTILYTLWWPNNEAEYQFDFPIVLDGLAKNDRFSEQFCGETPKSSDNFFETNKPTGSYYNHGSSLNSAGEEGGSNPLITGENITVTVTVSSFLNTPDAGGNINEDYLLSASASATDNSLFAYDNGIVTTQINNKNEKTGLDGTTYKAFIEYGRHLQNLDESSGIVKAISDGKIGATSIEAVQIKDIDFEGEDVVDYSPLNVVLWHEFADGKTNFTPITNEFLTSYNGKNENAEFAKQQHVIKNLVIDETDLGNSAIEGRLYLKDDDSSLKDENFYAGLFRIYYGKELKNVVLIDPKITGLRKKRQVVGPDETPEPLGTVASVGALAGYVDNSNDYCEITGCKVLITSEETPLGGTTAEPTGWIKTVEMTTQGTEETSGTP